MKWAKISSNLHTHPKVRKAGRDGRDVFVFLLLKNAELEAGGVLDAQYVDPDYLADMLGVTHETACNGVKRSIVSSLIDVSDDVVRLIGWDTSEFSGVVGTSTDRVRKHRERKRQEDGETLRNVSCNRGNGETPKRRVEESRKELSPDRSAAPRFDLDAVYAAFPRKAGKAKGLERLAKLVKTEDSFRSVLAAAEAMGRLWAGADPTYCPHFSTWVNQRRWEDPEQQGPSTPSEAVRSPQSPPSALSGRGRRL